MASGDSTRDAMFAAIERAQQRLEERRVADAAVAAAVVAAGPPPAPSLPTPSARTFRAVLGARHEAAGTAAPPPLGTSLGMHVPPSAPSAAAFGGIPRARDNIDDFTATWTRVIERFAADAAKTTLELPPDLSANDRRVLHLLSERFNLAHMSTGAGAARRLVLRKDELTRRAPQMRPTEEQLDQFKAAASGVGPAGGAGAGGVAKTNKYQLRRPAADAAEGPEFADAEVQRALRKLDRATDQFRGAVQAGQTTAELLAVATGGGGNSSATATVGSASTATAVAGARWDAALAPPAEKLVDAGAGAAAASRAYEEQCLTCGRRAPLDYDVSKWDSVGYCAGCNSERVWRLIDVSAKAAALRFKNASAAAAAAAVPEEIVREGKREREDGDDSSSGGEEYAADN